MLESRHLAYATAAAALTLGMTAGPAHAAWSTPQQINASSLAGDYALAVNAHGDAAVVWTTRTPAYRTSVHLAVRLASGGLIRRVVWTSHDARALAPAVALTRNEVTVVWGSESRARPASGFGYAIRATYAKLTGSANPVQTIGHWAGPGLPANREPRLAAATDGQVLLAWDDDHLGAPAVAWRSTGHPFGKRRRLSTSPLVPREMGPTPQFDASGAAYVTGACDGIVVRTPGNSRRFQPPIQVAPNPVLGFTLSLGGSGQGLAGWVRGTCTSDAAAGDTPGPVYASALDGGTFTAPRLVAGGDVFRAGAVAPRGAGGTVSWRFVGTTSAPGYQYGVTTAYSATVTALGVPGPAQTIGRGLVPFTGDGRGDVVLSSPFWMQLPFAQDGIAVRPAGGGPDQPAPATNGLVATAAPRGRTIGLGFVTGKRSSIGLTIWRP